MFSKWFVALLTLMVSTRVTDKSKRSRKNQDDSEFIALDESKIEFEE